MIGRRRSLIDLIAADVARDPLDAPAVDVQDAVLRQDMEWLLAANRSERSQQCTAHDRQHAEDHEEHREHDEGVTGDAVRSGWLLSHVVEGDRSPS